MFLRCQDLANQSSIGDSDLDELFYLNLSQDYERFLHRIIMFYRHNFEKATDDHCVAARKRLDVLVHRILPSAKELKQVLRWKRKQIKVKK
jgi:hypothetical protein